MGLSDSMGVIILPLSRYQPMETYLTPKISSV